MQRRTDYESILDDKFDDIDEALRKKTRRESNRYQNYDYDKELFHSYLENEDDEYDIVSDAIQEALGGYVNQNGELPAFMQRLYH